MEIMNMPNIESISGLKKHPDILKEANTLLSKLKDAEECADKEGGISADDAEKNWELCYNKIVYVW